MMGSKNLCGTIRCINTRDTWKHYTGASKYCFQCNVKTTREMNLSRSPNRLTNVLESCDNECLLSNNARTNTLYEYQ